MSWSEKEINNLVADKLVEVVRKKPHSVSEELIESGILNSLTVTELAVELERTFHVSFSFIEINKENFTSVLTIQKLISSKL